MQLNPHRIGSTGCEPLVIPTKDIARIRRGI